MVYDDDTGRRSYLRISRESYRHDLEAAFLGSKEGARAREVRSIMRAIAIGLLIAGLIAFELILRFSKDLFIAANAFGLLALLAFILAYVAWSSYSSALLSYSPAAPSEEERRQREDAEALARDTRLPALLRYNREQMALYHRIATTQARAAGRNSQIAIAVGFVTLTAGATVAIVTGDVTTKLVTGGLAALGGIFSGYIAKTFFVAQDKAIAQLYQYWEQPLTTSYVLTAERIAEAFSDAATREHQLGRIVDQLLLIAVRRELPSSSDASRQPRTRRRSGNDESIDTESLESEDENPGAN